MVSNRKEKVMFQVAVGPAIYTAIKVDGLKTDGQVFGLCDNLDKEISVRAGMQPVQELQTTLHELLHAVINEYAIRNAAKLEPDDEEVIVDLVALGLTQAFVSSPQLMKYIQDRIKGK